MKSAAPLLSLFLLLLALFGCEADIAVTAVPTRISAIAMPSISDVIQIPSTNTARPPATAVPVLPTPTAKPPSTATATLVQPPQVSPVPSATPDDYSHLTIDTLAAREFGGGELDIVDELEVTETFTRYLITYPSDGLLIYGFMNVPHEGDRFPVAVVLHGYIEPGEYKTVAYTRRYADHLAEAGYFVIHPNLRNYPPSDNGPNPFRIGYAADVLNLLAIIREQSQDPLGYLRRADAEHVHLWGHSMGGGIILRVLTVSDDPGLRAAVLYGAMSGEERQNYERIEYWSYGRRGGFELSAPPAFLELISPANYLDKITVPLAVHHSVADELVPVAWSQTLCEQLAQAGKPHECFFYEAQPHTFRGHADNLFMERVTAFFREN